MVEQGAALALGGAKQRAVLAILLIHRGEVLSSERLVDELWGERPPTTAAKTLQGYVSRLRQAIGGGVLQTHGRGYRLALEPGQVDVDEFQRLAATGRVALRERDAYTAAERLRDALGVWRGAALADFAYEPFAQDEIARLEEARIACHEDRIDAELALGRHAEAVGALEPLIAAHPFRERLRAQLMLALYRCDRQADALQAYQDARNKLTDELGIEPSERLRQLERAIIAQDPSLALDDRGQLAAKPATPATRAAFVDREAELGELVAGLDDAFAGRGRLFLLVGEPGIGKSRLAEELIGRGRARGARLMVGRCWEAGGAPAFWPWVQSLRSYLRASDRDDLVHQLGPGAVEIAPLLPELYKIVSGLPEPAPVESEGARFRLFNATAEFLRRASASRPIMLVLDDLHAADTPSLLLLQFLARELGSMHVLVLAALRDVDPPPAEPLTAMLAEVTREPVTRRVALSGLSEHDVSEYVELAAAEIASGELASMLHAETEGNPLFVAESVRLLALEGVREPNRAGRLAIPQSVRDVISRRLAHLSPECNRLLALASVLGREFTLDLLAHIAAVSEDQVLDTLDEAMIARVVSEVPGVAGRLRFAHVLIRDTLYDRLTTARRVQLHRRALEALEARYGNESGPQLAALAHHAIVGRDYEKARAYASQAGDRALGLLAYEEAERLYRTALEAMDFADVSDDWARCDLLLSLGEAQARAGNTPAAKTVFIEAARIARALELPMELARAAVGYGGRIAWVRAGRDHLLVPLCQEALAAIPEKEVELRARLLARLAGALRDEPSRERRDALSREAVELARRSGSLAALAYALDGRAETIVAPDTVSQCLALGNELCEVAERIGDRERLVHGHMDRFVAHVLAGDIQEAQIDLDAMNRIAEQLRQPAQLSQGGIAQAMLALGTGRLTEAEDLVPKAFAIGERSLPEMVIPVYQVQRYTLCEFRGTLEEVEPAIVDLVADYPARPVFRCVLAHLYALLGRLPEAKRLLDELSPDEFSALPFDQEWLYGMSLLAETSTVLDDADSAAVLYRLMEPWAALNAVDHPEGMRGSVSRYLGLLAATLGRPDVAAVHYEDAIAMNRNMGARPWLAYTQNDYARILLARDGPDDAEHAEKLLNEALATFCELGMKTHAAQSSAFAQELQAGRR